MNCLTMIMKLVRKKNLMIFKRIYDVFKGDILIDDINIKDYNLFELRKKIGLVKQEEVLFKRGIYENILYGNLNASKDTIRILADLNKAYPFAENTLEKIETEQYER